MTAHMEVAERENTVGQKKMEAFQTKCLTVMSVLVDLDLVDQVVIQPPFCGILPLRRLDPE